MAAPVHFQDLAVGPDPQLPLEAFQARRQKIADALGEDEILVVPTAPASTYANDVEYRFRPNSDFWYLTGFVEPESAVAIEGGTGKTHLFLRSRKPEEEIWTGLRLGLDRSPDTLGIDRAHDIEDFGSVLRDLLKGKATHAVLHHHRDAAETVRNAAEGEVTDAAERLVDHRRVKDADEIRMMRKAAELGMQGMRNALPFVRQGNWEFQVEAELLRTYRMGGSTGPGYTPIVGSGMNAAVLHYMDNNGPVHGGQLTLIDAGCEWGYYNSDITRTIAADGEWTTAQSDLYDLVAKAHQAAISEVQPGNRFLAPHDMATRVMAQGLIDLGYLKGDVDKVIEDKEHRRFFMHGTSHMIGVDVHDGRIPGKKQDTQDRLLEPGHILTVEPGLYFNPAYTQCPEAAAGIGIRIENDIVVTEDGHEDLNAALPTERDAVTDLLLGR